MVLKLVFTIFHSLLYNYFHCSCSLLAMTSINSDKKLQFQGIPCMWLEPSDNLISGLLQCSLAVGPSVPVTQGKGYILDPSTVKIDMSLGPLHLAYWVSVTASEADWYPQAFEVYFRTIISQWTNGEVFVFQTHMTVAHSWNTFSVKALS